jgi:hypothetical protein
MITVTPIRTEFLIVGHGRSGTHYMAEMFRWLGFKVGRHWHGEDGMAHNFPQVARSGVWPFSEARKYYKYLIQVVREPRKVIESTYLCSIYPLIEETSSLIPEISQGTEIDRSARSVVFWNQAIKAGNPDLTVKLENNPIETCQKWLESNNLSRPIIPEPPPNTNINARNKHHGDLDRPIPPLSPEIATLVNEHCLEYGYPKCYTL